MSPRPGVVGPLPNGRTPWLVNGGDPNYLLTQMILQVPLPKKDIRKIEVFFGIIPGKLAQIFWFCFCLEGEVVTVIFLVFFCFVFS